MAVNPNLLAGEASLSVNGITYLLQGKLTYSTGSVKRETLGGQDQIHGFSEMPRAPHISGTLRDTSGLLLNDFNKMQGVTLTMQIANGKTITGRNMWTVDAQEVNTEDGTFDVKWEGLTGSVTEQ